MSETAPEPAPAVPEPTDIERVAQLAAERAAGALPDYGPRLAAAEQLLAEIGEALTAAAGPEGNAAKLSARLEQVERELAALRDAGPQPDPKQQKHIDDLHQRVATLERTKP